MGNARLNLIRHNQMPQPRLLCSGFRPIAGVSVGLVLSVDGIFVTFSASRPMAATSHLTKHPFEPNPFSFECRDSAASTSETLPRLDTEADWRLSRGKPKYLWVNGTGSLGSEESFLGHLG
jgi:hypothetical protein